MTRDEAKRKIMDALFPPGSFKVVDCCPGAVLPDFGTKADEYLNVAVALGLKLDEPKTVESELTHLCVKITEGVVASANCRTNEYIGVLTKNSVADVIAAIQRAGFKIVKDSA